MKSFNTIQELWAYCLFCPICQDMTRDVKITVGPYKVFQLNNYEKDNHILHLNGHINIKNKKYEITYHINELDNTFTCDFSPSSINNEFYVTKASIPFFNFFIDGVCRPDCHSNISSANLELNFLHKKVTGIKLEVETVFIVDQNVEYCISLDYVNESLTIARKLDQTSIKVLNYPLIDLNLSDPKKLLQKIKTILVFS